MICFFIEPIVVQLTSDPNRRFDYIDRIGTDHRKRKKHEEQSTLDRAGLSSVGRRRGQPPARCRVVVDVGTIAFGS